MGKVVDYKVKEDEFNRIIVSYEDETGYTRSACAKLDVYGTKTKSVEALCETLGISTEKLKKGKKETK